MKKTNDNHHFEKALDCFNDSLAKFENFDVRSRVCQKHITLAEQHIKTGNLDEARHACDAGMQKNITMCSLWLMKKP